MQWKDKGMTLQYLERLKGIPNKIPTKLFSIFKRSMSQTRNRVQIHLLESRESDLKIS